MRNNSSGPSKGSRPGPGRPSASGRPSFNKEGGARPFNKNARPQKKNYDGRSPSSDASGPGGDTRSSKPYSGRATGTGKPFEKPSFSRDGSNGKRPNGERGPRNEFDAQERPDRPGMPFGERKPRSFDKPDFKKEGRSKPGYDKKPFRDKDKPSTERPGRTFEKPGFRQEGTDSGARNGKPFRESGKPFTERPKRTFDKPAFRKDADDTAGEDRKGDEKYDRPFSKRPDRKFDKPAFDKNSGANGEDERPRRKVKTSDSRPFRERPEKKSAIPFSDKKDNKEGEEKIPKTFSDVVKNVFNAPSKHNDPNEDHPGKREQFEDKVYGELGEVVNDTPPKKPFEIKKKAADKKHIHDHSGSRKKKYKEEDDDQDEDDKDGPRLEMPLNKFIAHSGECSRRDAAELVKQGKVKVNGELVLDPGYRVKHDDKVTMSGKKLTPQKGMVYILLNKPKGFITTNDDPQGRKTVMELVGNSGVDRLFPVGRLDRDTSGLLLITNDGDLTQKLCHPAYNIKKVYQVTLDKPLIKADFEKIVEGVDLEDGKAIVDAISYLEKKNELGLEIHSGRNRIVRRIFESLGYVVEKLDRVMYAGLTKKNLPRSKWRYLDEREVILLKHFKN